MHNSVHGLSLHLILGCKKYECVATDLFMDVIKADALQNLLGSCKVHIIGVIIKLKMWFCVPAFFGNLVLLSDNCSCNLKVITLWVVLYEKKDG